MADEGKPKEYRFLEVSPGDHRTLRVLIYHPMCAQYVQALSRYFPLKDITGPGLDAERLDEVDVLLGWKFPASVLPSLCNLKWIQTTTAGIDHVLEHYRRYPDLIVTTTKGLHVESVSSYVLLMILTLHWRLPLRMEHQRKHLWKSNDMPPAVRASTCAIVGLGNIGRMVASHGKHLGMTVTGVKRRMERVPEVDRLYREEELHEMLGAADFVVLTLPLTDRTRGMFGGREFDAMKRSAYLINVARGGVVDEHALLAALRSSTIAGAAFDVFDEEPLPPSHPLWSAPNLIITPHVAGDRSDYVEAAASVFAENLMRFPDRSRMRGLASGDEGY